MEQTDIREGLSKFVDEYTSQTNKGTFRSQKRDSLLAPGLGTRANSIWKMAEYLVAFKDDDGETPKEEYLKGWCELTRNYKDQHLFLEVDDEGHWEMYDSFGAFLGGNDYIEKYLRSHKRVTTGYVQKVATCANETPAALQVIYYGAPGTGKSHKVERIVSSHKQHTFRVTFHPDSDYSTFVGAYKPISRKTQEATQLYNAIELKQLYKSFKASGESRPIHKFAAFHYQSLEMLPLTEQKQIFTYNGEAESTVEAEISKGKAVGEYLDRVWKRNTENNKVSYEFVPQAFTKAYIDAWKNPDEPVFLIIEEINRGNCAQIFGDLFQLLDRDEDGVSKYPIKPDDDLLNFLKDRSNLGLLNEGIEGDNIKLPSNLYILATMNTSDQSLFPMDIAFKRRWLWEYTKIDYSDASKFSLNIDAAHTYNWGLVLNALNNYIKSEDGGANKLIGNRFVQTSDNNIITYSLFRDKVLFYLFGDVFKDNDNFALRFFGTYENYTFFEDLCDNDNTQITIDFIERLIEEYSTLAD